MAIVKRMTRLGVRAFDRYSGRVQPDGFTLVEVIVAMGIFSVLLVGTAAMIATLARGNAYGEMRSRSTYLIQEQIEQFHNTPFNQLSNGSREQALPSGAKIRVQWAMVSVVPGRLFRADVTVRRVPSGPGGTERAVQVFLANRAP